MKDEKRKYDFAGWVTKNDIRCSDGVVIKHDAFRDNDGQKVPLVWDHNYSSPSNVLGHVILQNHKQGVYGYGYFNDSAEADNAKKLVKHGDIQAMSIGARKLKRSGTDIVHGSIYEVSLVLAGANPGAMIESVMTHSEDGTEEAVIYTDQVLHSAEDLPPTDDPKKDESKDDDPKKDESKDDKLQHNDPTIKDVLDTLTPQQEEAVYALLGMVADSKLPEGDEGDDNKKEDKEVDNLKQNVFDKSNTDGAETLKHSLSEVLKTAKNGNGSFREALNAAISNDDTLKHGINSIEMLFPEAFHTTNGNTPILYKDPNTAYETILAGTSKSPFSRIRTLVADITEAEARAKGYIKGNMKKEEFFSLIKRTTTPGTIYKKQKLDRDDIIDITDFDVVNFMKNEMKIMLKEEIARAVLVGDGREIDDEDKISEQTIRPIISDHEFFTIKKNFTNAAGFIEAVLLAKKEYRGSGLPTMYIDPTVLTSVKLLKGNDGRYLMGHIPTNAELCAILGLSSIVETSFMVGKGALIVNLRDYTLGSAKGGEITNFDDFDIDFNQYKYLIETRLCGALTLPKSAIHMNPGSSAATGADDETANMTFGKRQADKTEPGA